MKKRRFCENCGWEYTLDHLANWTGLCDKCGHYNEEHAEEFLKKRTGRKNGKFKITKEMDEYLDEPCVEEV